MFYDITLELVFKQGFKTVIDLSDHFGAANQAVDNTRYGKRVLYINNGFLASGSGNETRALVRQLMHCPDFQKRLLSIAREMRSLDPTFSLLNDIHDEVSQVITFKESFR